MWPNNHNTQTHIHSDPFLSQVGCFTLTSSKAQQISLPMSEKLKTTENVQHKGLQGAEKMTKIGTGFFQQKGLGSLELLAFFTTA